MVVLLGLIVAGCASSPSRPKPKQEVDRAPQANQSILKRLQQLPDPKVVPVKPGKRGNGPVYTVLGKSYRVMSSARGFKQEGMASWYGDNFHGRQTANGETFNMNVASAAHERVSAACLRCVRIARVAREIAFWAVCEAAQNRGKADE